MDRLRIDELGFHLAGVTFEQRYHFPLSVLFLRQMGFELSIAAITRTEKRAIRNAIEDLQTAIFHGQKSRTRGC